MAQSIANTYVWRAACVSLPVRCDSIGRDPVFAADETRVADTPGRLGTVRQAEDQELPSRTTGRSRVADDFISRRALAPGFRRSPGI